MKLWSGRFSKDTNALVEKYNASIEFDYRLAHYDIEGSIAHVTMLSKCDVLEKQEADCIIDGLVEIKEKLKQDECTFELSDEDIHMALERMLYQLIGEVAGKLHTGRSRNDQVALDMHLYLRAQVVLLVEKIYGLLVVLHRLAMQHIDTILPGYTHLQRAEPIRFAHHLMAYFQMFCRDAKRLCQSFARINICPLGAGALAGSGIAIDREYVAKLLDFDGLYENSLDAVSDRDFIIEFLSNASLMMMHFSKFSEELILWNSQEFSFIQFDDAFCTGSSMMPQKKNPDVCELARGKTGRVYGSLMALLTVLKGLPLAYNKDMQEDKEGVFDAVNTLDMTLSVYTPLLDSMIVNQKAMKNSCMDDFSSATTIANYLVDKAIPFRKAHEITGKIVLHCIDKECSLYDLSLETYQTFCEHIKEDIYHQIDCVTVIESHDVRGGTSKNAVKNQLNLSLTDIDEIKKWLDKHDKYKL
jgi:argininosuccinate lyase